MWARIRKEAVRPGHGYARDGWEAGWSRIRKAGRGKNEEGQGFGEFGTHVKFPLSRLRRSYRLLAVIFRRARGRLPLLCIPRTGECFGGFVKGVARRMAR